jgi:hypothetical protein
MKTIGLLAILLISQQTLAVDLVCQYVGRDGRNFGEKDLLRLDVEKKTSKHWSEFIRGDKTMALTEYPTREMTVEDHSLDLKLHENNFTSRLSRDDLVLVKGLNTKYCRVTDALDWMVNTLKDLAEKNYAEMLKKRKI